MDASAGVEAGLEHAVAEARGDLTAACFFINKSDRENADPTAALDALRAGFGEKIAPLQIAIGAAESFEGYVDLVHRKAWRWNGTTEEEIPIPDELADEVARRRDQLLEAAAEADDDVLTKYLEGEEIADPELEACLRKGVKESILAPVLVGSATKGIGLRGLLDAIVRYLPSPADEPPAQADRQVRRARSRSPADEAGPLLVRVFKTTADPFVGRLTYLRVLSGTLHSQAHVWNGTRSEDERIGQLLLLHGKEQEPIGELKAGEIGAVAKLTVTETGDTLTPREKPLTLPPLDFPEPSLMVAIEPQSKGDLDKMGPALARMLEEEPTVRLERSGDRRAGPADDGRGPHRGHHRAAQAQVRGGDRDPHARRSRTRRRSAARPRSTAATRSRPAATGCSATSGSSSNRTPMAASSSPSGSSAGRCPKGFFAGVEKGIREAAEGGVIAGYPLSDFRATLYDGSFHPVDSNELSFKIAASMALKDGVHHAKPALLEPIMAVEIRIPEAYMGEVNRDLNGRRGRVLGMDTDGDMQVITAHVPQAELFNYATELRSLAQGRGSFSATLDHYEDVPVAHRREGHRDRTARSSRRPAGTRPRAGRRAAIGATRPAAANASVVDGSVRRRHRRRALAIERVEPRIEPALVRGAATDDRARRSRRPRSATGCPRRSRCRADAMIAAAPSARRGARRGRGPGPPAGRRGRWRSPRRSRRPRRPGGGWRLDGVDARVAGRPAVTDGPAVADVDRDRDPRRARGSRPGGRRMPGRGGLPSRRRPARRPPRGRRRPHPSVRRPPATSTRQSLPDRGDDGRDRRRHGRDARSAPRRGRRRGATAPRRRRTRPRSPTGSSPNAVSRAKSPCLQADHAAAAQVDRRQDLEGRCHHHGSHDIVVAR